MCCAEKCQFDVGVNICAMFLFPVFVTVKQCHALHCQYLLCASVLFFCTSFLSRATRFALWLVFWYFEYLCIFSYTYRMQDMRASVPVINTVGLLHLHTFPTCCSQSPHVDVKLICALLVVPRTRLRVGERAFSSASRRLWNALPTDIKRAATLLTFKTQDLSFLRTSMLILPYFIIAF